MELIKNIIEFWEINQYGKLFPIRYDEIRSISFSGADLTKTNFDNVYVSSASYLNRKLNKMELKVINQNRTYINNKLEKLKYNHRIETRNSYKLKSWVM